MLQNNVLERIVGYRVIGPAVNHALPGLPAKSIFAFPGLRYATPGANRTIEPPALPWRIILGFCYSDKP